MQLDLLREEAVSRKAHNLSSGGATPPPASKNYGPSAGGKVMAVVQRQAALRKYYSDPVVCLSCGAVLKVGEDDKVTAIRRRKFCNRSCAIRFNNKIPGRKRRKAQPRTLTCSKCKVVFEDRGKKKLCAGCKLRTLAEIAVGKLTHSEIRSHARAVMDRGGKEKKCRACDYGIFVDVCHLTPVAAFAKDTLLKVVNAASNLEYFCKNHHWEFDHGFLNL